MYGFFVIISLAGIIIFIIKKTILGAFFWLSLMANLFCYLFFMGYYHNYPYALFAVINLIWPVINLGLLLWLIISFFRDKNAKAKVR